MRMLRCVLLVLVWSTGSGKPLSEYMKERQQMLLSEERDRIGSGIWLSPEEKWVDEALRALKNQEIDDCGKNGNPFPPQINFLAAKSYIESSKVFQFIRDMPKGGILHIHDFAIADVRWLLKIATHTPHCYMCDKPDQLKFHFFKTPPPPTPDCAWKLVSEERKTHGESAEFDEMLYNKTVFTLKDVEKLQGNQTKIWKRFKSYFATVMGLLLYAPIFPNYIYKGLQELSKDNIQYVEMRVSLAQTYELDGTVHDKIHVFHTMVKTAQRYLASNSDMVGIKLIQSANRNVKPKEIEETIKIALKLQKQYPEWFAGFDLVSQEDTGCTLIHYLRELIVPSGKLKYFFHAGETDWQGTVIDENLIDALLLNTTRIGHGYAALKHPVVLSLIKQRQIAIEINPISNQVLGLVSDMRNHPASYLIANNFPVVISSDDPVSWQASGLSYDYYETFMGIASQHAGLRLLKQLTINSLSFSSMSDIEKEKAKKLWERKWNEFIHQSINKM